MTVYSAPAADEVAEVIARGLPVPADVFEAGLYYSALAGAAGELAGRYKDVFEATAGRIEQEGAVSDVYELRRRVRQEQRVDTARLKREAPEVFYALVHVKASTAERLLSRSALYALVRERVDEGRLASYEAVNVADLTARMPPEEARGFVVPVERDLGWQIVRR